MGFPAKPFLVSPHREGGPGPNREKGVQENAKKFVYTVIDIVPLLLTTQTLRTPTEKLAYQSNVPLLRFPDHDAA